MRKQQLFNPPQDLDKIYGYKKTNSIHESIHDVPLHIAHKEGKYEPATIQKGATGRITHDLAEHFVKVGKYLVYLWENGFLSDVSVNVEDYTFHVHKIVLSCHSSYFAEQFVSSKGISTEITIDKISSNGFMHALEFMYLGKTNFRKETIGETLHTARFLKMEKLSMNCENFITKVMLLEEGTVWSVLLLAEKYNILDVKDRAERILKHRFKDLYREPEFLMRDIEQICNLLTDDELVVDSELDVLRAALYWIEYDRNSRMRHAFRLLECVRLGLMSFNELYTCAQEGKHLMRMHECQDLIAFAFWQNGCITHSKPLLDEFPVIDARPRKFYVKHVNASNQSIVSMVDSQHKAALSTSFTGMKQQHTPQQQPNTTPTTKRYQRQYSNETINENKKTHPPLPFPPATIGIVGGMVPDATKKSDRIGKCCYEYHIRTNHWAPFSNLPVPKMHHAAVAFNGLIYIVGGCEPKGGLEKIKLEASNSAYRYDPKVDTWQELPPMREKRMFHQLGVLNGKLYAVGGENESRELLSSVECYNPITNSWNYVSSLNTPRMGFAVSSYHGVLVVAGGLGIVNPKSTLIPPVLNIVECCDPETNSWSTMQSLRYPRTYAAMAGVNGLLHFVGGSTYETSSGSDEPNLVSVPDVDVYNFDSNTWQYKTSLCKPKHSITAVSYGTRLYVIGGVTFPENEVSNTVECFDTETSTWLKNIESMPQALMGFGCCLI